MDRSLRVAPVRMRLIAHALCKEILEGKIPLTGPIIRTRSSSHVPYASLLSFWLHRRNQRFFEAFLYLYALQECTEINKGAPVFNIRPYRRGYERNIAKSRNRQLACIWL